jgi:hypothetical protein
LETWGPTVAVADREMGKLPTEHWGRQEGPGMGEGRETTSERLARGGTVEGPHLNG